MKYHEILTALGGRKFIFAIALVIMAIVLLFTAKLNQAGFIELIQWIGVGYLGANAAAKVTNRLAGVPGRALELYVHEDKLAGQEPEDEPTS